MTKKIGKRRLVGVLHATLGTAGLTKFRDLLTRNTYVNNLLNKFFRAFEKISFVKVFECCEIYEIILSFSWMMTWKKIRHPQQPVKAAQRYVIPIQKMSATGISSRKAPHYMSVASTDSDQQKDSIAIYQMLVTGTYGLNFTEALFHRLHQYIYFFNTYNQSGAVLIEEFGSHSR